MRAGERHPSSAWDRVAPAYAAEIVPLFEQFSREALRRVAPPPGARVLDVACGPGTLALLAAEAGAHVTAVDLSAGMIEQLRLRASARGLTDVACVVADGQSLPVPSEAFDAAFSMFGLIFFPDRARGLQELRRALRPGGRVALSSWAPVESNAFLSTLWSCLQESFALPARVGPELSSPDALRRELTAAGLGEVDVDTLTQGLTRGSVEETWAWFSQCSPQLLQLQETFPARWEPFRERALRRLSEVLGPGPVRIELTAYLALGRRPGAVSDGDP